MKKDFKYIDILNNGIIHYDSGMRAWTKEEIDEIDGAYYKESEKYIKEALKDGFIEFPIMWENGPDEVIWSACYLPPNFMPSNCPEYKEKYGLKYNIYIPSYKRAGIELTSKTLDYFGITNYYFCVDPDQYPEYKKVYGKEKVIIRDHTFKKDNKTNKMSSINSPHYLVAGSAFMNALLYMTKSLGDKKYWMLDDDIFSLGIKAPKRNVDTTSKDWVYNKDDFYRASSIVRSGVDFSLKDLLADLEDFSDKCKNIGSVALEKYGIVFNKPVGMIYGTRAYSFFLADATTQPDERGFQNNDTINSIDFGTMGYVNAIFEGFQYDTPSSQLMQGGCTGAYTSFGTLDKGKSLVAACPNVSKISYLHSRIHHVVDYSPFTQIRLVGKEK